MLAGRVPAALTACREVLDRHHDPVTDGQVRICLAHALLARRQVCVVAIAISIGGRSLPRWMSSVP